MKKFIAVIMCAVMLICAFPLGVFAYSDYVTFDSIRVETEIKFIEGLDCHIADFDPQTGEQCEPFCYYDIYDINPVITVIYSDKTEVTQRLSEIFANSSLQVKVASNQSAASEWGVGEHFFEVDIDDFHVRMRAEIIENPYSSITISGDKTLSVILNRRDGGVTALTPYYFAPTSGEPGNEVGYLYTKEGVVLACSARYDAKINESDKTYSYDRTKNLSFTFGKMETNAINASWLKDNTDSTVIIGEFVSLGITEFENGKIDLYNEKTVQAVLLSYALRAQDSGNNGVGWKVSDASGTVDVFAGAQTVKDAFTDILGVDIDIAAVPGYNSGSDKVEVSGVEYDFFKYVSVDDVDMYKDGSVVTFTIYRINDYTGDVDTLNPTIRYAVFDKNNALTAIAEKYPDDKEINDISVADGFDNITVDNKKGLIFVRPETPSGIAAGRLTAAFNTEGKIFCDPEETAGTGMCIYFDPTPYNVIIYGDADSNGRITAADARAALRISAKLDSTNEFNKLSLDLNNDGKITAGEARKILRFSARLEAEL